MRFKLDENLPVLLMEYLERLGHDVDTVPAEGLTGCDDGLVWQAAQLDGRFLITQDLDFSDVRRYRPGTHCGLLLVRLSSPSRLAVVHRIATLFATEDVDSWAGCLIVATEHKIRVKRPDRSSTSLPS